MKLPGHCPGTAAPQCFNSETEAIRTGSISRSGGIRASLFSDFARTSPSPAAGVGKTGKNRVEKKEDFPIVQFNAGTGWFGLTIENKISAPLPFSGSDLPLTPPYNRFGNDHRPSIFLLSCRGEDLGVSCRNSKSCKFCRLLYCFWN